MKTIRSGLMAKRFFPIFYLALALASAGFAQTVPVVTIQATDVHGTWTGDPAVFTVFRSGNPAPVLNVYCCISGTAAPTAWIIRRPAALSCLPPASCPTPL